MLVKTARKYENIVYVIYGVTAGLFCQHCLQRSHKTSQRTVKTRREFVCTGRLSIEIQIQYTF